MDNSVRELRPTGGRLWGLLALLLVLNLTLMAVDAVVLPGRGIMEVMLLNPAPRPEVRPQRGPNQLDQLWRGWLGVRPIGTERPQTGLFPSLTEPRLRPPVTRQPSLRPFSLHQPGWGGMTLHLVGLLALLSTSVVLTFFLPGRFRVMRDILRGPWAHRLRTLAIGVFGYLAALLLAFLLAVVVSGLPYAVLVLAVLAVLTAVGVTAVALALGRWLSSLVGAVASPLAQLLLGVLLVFPLTVLPYVGWAAAAVIASLGMGATVLTRLGSGRSWSLRALEE